MIVKLEEDQDGYLVLPIPEEMWEELGWNIGDTIDWVDNGDGTWTLRKKQVEKELVLVECISTFRMRYVVEVPVGKKDWACDSVVMGEVEEMSQHHIGEDIVSHRVISNDEFVKIFDEDNDYLKSWNTEQKMRCIQRWVEESKEAVVKGVPDDIEHSEHWYDKDRNR